MHKDEVETGERFEFGKNWLRYIESLTEERISIAIRSLQDILQVETLDGKSFLDIGSGSGLFSLAAQRLGARVVSVDYDPCSVECTKIMKQRHGAPSSQWDVMEGSALDAGFIESLGSFDVVYS